MVGVWTIFFTLLGLLQQLAFAYNGFVPSNPCIVSISGGLKIVRTVYLSCDQGMLAWNRPSGSLLVRFSPPPISEPSNLESFSLINTEDKSLLLAKRKSHMCLRFPEDHSPLIIVQRMVNMKLEKQLNTTHNRLHCWPIEVNQKTQILMKVRPVDNERITAGGFHYFVEEMSNAAAFQDSICGECSSAQFRHSFCSTNFVFIGRLLRQLPEGDAMEYSISSVLRRPSRDFDFSQLHPRNTFGTATLLSKCPPHSIASRALHSEFVVVADAYIGVARIACALAVNDLKQLINEEKNSPTNSSECELKID